MGFFKNSQGRELQTLPLHVPPCRISLHLPSTQVTSHHSILFKSLWHLGCELSVPSTSCVLFTKPPLANSQYVLQPMTPFAWVQIYPLRPVSWPLGKILTTFSSTPSFMSRIVLDGDCSGLLGMLLVLILRISLPFTSANCHPVEHAKP